jgi:hypothetical protein
LSALVAATERRSERRHDDDQADWAAVRDGFEHAIHEVLRTLGGRRWKRLPPPGLAEAVVELGGVALDRALALDEGALDGGSVALLGSAPLATKPEWRDRRRREALLHAWVDDACAAYMRMAIAVTNAQPRAAVRPLCDLVESCYELSSWLLGPADSHPFAFGI